MSEDLPGLLLVLLALRQLSVYVCVPVCAHVHVRGELFRLVLMHEVGRNGPQAPSSGEWRLVS